MDGLANLLRDLPPSIKLKIIEQATEKQEEEENKEDEEEQISTPPLFTLPPPTPAALSFFSTESLAQLLDPGYFLRSNFLSSSSFSPHEMSQACQLMVEQGRLRSAKMKADLTGANTDTHWLNTSLRSDLICFLNPSDISLPAPLSSLLRQLLSIQVEINRAFPSFQSKNVSFQFSCFSGNGERYIRHKDTFLPSGPARRITIICYLNENWKEEEEGGCLRIFPSPSSSSSCFPAKSNSDRHIDIAPCYGTLIIFDSLRIEHEVLPAFRPRFALTAWLS